MMWAIAQSLYRSMMTKGSDDFIMEFLNLRLTPIENMLVILYLSDMCGPFLLTKLLTRLNIARGQHFVVDYKGRVVLVFDSLLEAEGRAIELGKGFKVFSGAS
jgi:hypothetical protein